MYQPPHRAAGRRTLSPVALYAAYGSNMDPAQMLERCPHSPQRGSGWLEGWRLTFGGADIGWDGALTTVVEDSASRVFVVLYDMFETDEKALDSWDGVTLGYYRKVKVRVETLDGDVLAWLYVLNFYEGGLPSARHIGILADAAEKAGAPADYVTGLRTRPCGKPGDSGLSGVLPGLSGLSGQAADDQDQRGDQQDAEGNPAPGACHGPDPRCRPGYQG
jgi:AIG2-like family